MNDNFLAGRIHRLKYPHARIPTSTNSDKRSKLWGLSVFCLFVFLSVTGVDGGYSEWSSWSKCSATCGGGVSWSHRTCTKPSPSGDGKSCKEQNLGPDKKSKECNTQKCGKMTFHYYMKYFITHFFILNPNEKLCDAMNKSVMRTTISLSECPGLLGILSPLYWRSFQLKHSLSKAA